MRVLILLILLIATISANRFPWSDVKAIRFNNLNTVMHNGSAVPYDMYIICMMEPFCDDFKYYCRSNQGYLFLRANMTCDINEDGILDNSCVATINPSEERGDFDNFLFTSYAVMISGSKGFEQIIPFNPHELSLRQLFSHLHDDANMQQRVQMFMLSVFFMAGDKYNVLFHKYNMLCNFVRGFVHIASLMGIPLCVNFVLNFLLNNTIPWYVLLGRWALFSVLVYAVVSTIIDILPKILRYLYSKLQRVWLVFTFAVIMGLYTLVIC